MGGIKVWNNGKVTNGGQLIFCDLLSSLETKKNIFHTGLDLKIVDWLEILLFCLRK